jgi:hypothetical protein
MKTKELIIVLGLDEKQKPHAAKFDLSQADIVRKAAGLMGFRTAIPKSEDAIAQADRLTPGKLFATGKGLVPFCPKATYEQLVVVLELEPASSGTKEAPKGDTAASQGTTAEKGSPGAAESALTDPWAALKVGDKVIAPERKPADEGFWPAVITAVSKDGKTLNLRWTVGAANQPPFTLKRRAVALLYPG